jgi:hypothetical protein
MSPGAESGIRRSILLLYFSGIKVDFGSIVFSPAQIAATALHQCGARAFGPIDSAAVKAP